jgi:hypothetical protein
MPAQAYREVLSPVVAQMLAAASDACPVGADVAQLPGSRVMGRYPEPLLVKEAVYNAVAVGAYDLHDAIDYLPWLHGSLLQVRIARAMPTRCKGGFGVHLPFPRGM